MIRIGIPSFKMTGVGGESYVEYVICVRASEESWTLQRRFRQFRQLHTTMSQAYGSVVNTIPFPSRRLFGNKSEHLAQERRQLLQRYLNTLIQSCSEIAQCPLHKNPTKDAMVKFAAFFEDQQQPLSPAEEAA